MATAPVIPDNAPFTLEQRAWLNGMIAALHPSLASGTFKSQISNLESCTPPTPINILYGTQTGTAESLAKQTAKLAQKHHLTPTIADLAETTPEDLTTISHLLLITSTYGDGEPPDSAKPFYDALHAPTAPRLEHLTFSVLGLGDSSYPDFNQCAIDLDARLLALGATHHTPSTFCDVDYETAAATWQTTCFTSISSTIKS